MTDLDFEPVVLEETEETMVHLDGNGAKLRRHKLHSTTPEYVDFTVKERRAREEHVKSQLLDVDRRRIPFEGYRKERRKSSEENRHFCWSGLAPFEQMRPRKDCRIRSGSTRTWGSWPSRLCRRPCTFISCARHTPGYSATRTHWTARCRPFLRFRRVLGTGISLGRHGLPAGHGSQGRYGHHQVVRGLQ